MRFVRRSPKLMTSSPMAIDNCRSRLISTIAGCKSGWGRSRAPLFAMGSPKPTIDSSHCTEMADWMNRINNDFAPTQPGAPALAFSAVPPAGTAGAAGTSGGKKSLGIGLTSTFAVFFSALTTSF